MHMLKFKAKEKSTVIKRLRIVCSKQDIIPVKIISRQNNNQKEVKMK